MFLKQLLKFADKIHFFQTCCWCALKVMAIFFVITILIFYIIWSSPSLIPVMASSCPEINVTVFTLREALLVIIIKFGHWPNLHQPVCIVLCIVLWPFFHWMRVCIYLKLILHSGRSVHQNPKPELHSFFIPSSPPPSCFLHHFLN